MPQKILLLALCSSLFVSCDQSWLPASPNVFICSYSPTEKDFFCVSAKDQNHTMHIPEEQANAYVCTSPDDWKAVQEYIADLKKAASNSCH